MKVKDLEANERNPRKISKKRLEALQKSVEKFGDLSCITFNRRTKKLVSGHQRTKTIPADAKIVIDKKYDAPTRAKTVAEGYIEFEGEKHKYREVDADEKWEMEALLAANKHGGTWDADILRLAVHDIPDLDLEIAGFDQSELKEMNIKIEIPVFEEPVFTDESENEDDEPGAEEEEESDESYLENNPGPDSSVSKENISTAKTDAFQSIEETTEVLGKRFVIIIDCPSEEKKQELRGLLRPMIVEAGAKIF